MSAEHVSIPTSRIFGALNNTPFGSSLKSLERWHYFRNGETRADWRAIIGASANTFEHSVLFEGVGRSFLRHEGDERFSPDKQALLVAGFAVHDLGEAPTDIGNVGDVPAIFKNTDTEKKERVIAHYVIDSLPLSQQERDYLHYAYDAVVAGVADQPDLFHAFKSVEKTEYLMTILKVFQTSRRRQKQHMPLITSEALMVGEVILHSGTEVVQNIVPVYPTSIGHFVRNMEPLIDAAYAFSKPTLEGQGTYDEKIVRFEEVWSKFKQNASGINT